MQLDLEAEVELELELVLELVQLKQECDQLLVLGPMVAPTLMQELAWSID